jgi:hypothetical protein
MPPRASAQPDPDRQRKLLTAAVVLLVVAAVIFAVFFKRMSSDGLTDKQRVDVTTPLTMPMSTSAGQPAVPAAPVNPDAPPMFKPTGK